MTVEKYATLLGLDHYALGRDIVLESGDGTFAAFAICWADSDGSIGEFEPVGTHPDHQRRGLGRVIMRHGLRLMRAAGLRDALVFSLRTNAASEALYRSAGFHEVALHRRYTMALRG
jgi:ribosomal protein S18 acetylase RimI-like enzyme